jgi:hypothetical protein
VSVNASLPAGAFAPSVHARVAPAAAHELEPGATFPVARIVEPSATVTDCALADTSRRRARAAGESVAGAGTVTTKATSSACTVGAGLGAMVAFGLGVTPGLALGVLAGFALEVGEGAGVAVVVGTGDPLKFELPPLHAHSVATKSPAIESVRRCIRFLPLL